MRNIMKTILSRFFFILGILLLIPIIIIYFIMQVYIFNPYWIMIVICSLTLIVIYKNPKNNIKLRFLIYFITLSNIFTIYGFGTFCHGNYSFNIIGQYFCINLSAVLSENFNLNQLILYLSGITSLALIETSYLLKNNHLYKTVSKN